MPEGTEAQLLALARDQRNTAWTALIVFAVLAASTLLIMIVNVLYTEVNILHQRLITSIILTEECGTQIGSWFLAFAIVVFAIGCVLVFFQYRSLREKPLAADTETKTALLESPEAPYQANQLRSIIWFCVTEVGLAISLVTYLVETRSIYTSPMPTDIKCVNHEYWFTAALVFIAWVLVIPVIIMTYNLRTFVVTERRALEQIEELEKKIKPKNSTEPAGQGLGAVVRKTVRDNSRKLSTKLGALGGRVPPV